MSVLHYAVIRCGSEWKVVGGRRQMGHFSEKAAAATAGARLALQAAESGNEVEFLIQDDAGMLLTGDPLLHAALPPPVSSCDPLDAARAVAL
jgi:hypothetical protein